MSTSETDEAFVAFVRGNSAGLFRTAQLITGAAALAEELVQDTLASLYPVWPRVEAADEPLAYVRRAMANRFVSSLRKRGRQLPMTPHPIQDADAASTVRDPSESVSDRDLVFRMLDVLPPRSRAAVVYRYLHDMPDEQIAAALDCRPGTVRSLLSRALATLRASTQDPAQADYPRSAS